MSQVLFRCPTLRRDVETGIDVDQSSFELARDSIVRITCPLCAKTHEFLLADGWLAEVAPAATVVPPAE